MNLNKDSDQTGKNCTPPDIVQAAASASETLLPKKSQTKYTATYDRFIKWRETKNTKSLSENVLMTYFSELAKIMKPSTLWSHYSMLKTTLSTRNNIKIECYAKLTAFLKRQSVGFKSKKSKILSSEDVEKFLNEAPDHQYLATKVALIIGIFGACRREELYNITVNDVKDVNLLFLITLPKTKNYAVRSFTIIGEFYTVVKKYYDLRPKDVDSNHFFLNYQNGKCSKQVIGINKFGAMPKQIASYLNLPEPVAYTGHSFRRTSATLLAGSGANITMLKQHGGWKSASVDEGYIDESLDNKKVVSNLITESIVLNPSTSRENCHQESAPPDWDYIETGVSSGKCFVFEGGKSSTPQILELPQTSNQNQNLVFNFTNCSHLTLNIFKNQ